MGAILRPVSLPAPPRVARAGLDPQTASLQGVGHPALLDESLALAIDLIIPHISPNGGLAAVVAEMRLELPESSVTLKPIRSSAR